MAASDDPYIWLEDVHGARALEWVKGENAKTAARLEDDPRFETYRREALAIFTAKDRIAFPVLRGEGVDSFWQDDRHIHGLLRHATLASYKSGKPQWETLLDLDALSKAEGKNWIWKGADCLPPEERLCLVRLSDGGGDAVDLREFDMTSKKFVENGFHFDRAKQDVDWVDENTLIVGRIWTPGEETTSGYAYILKLVKRGEDIANAREVFRGDPSDAMVEPQVLREPGGRVRAIFATRRISFFESEYHLIDGDKPVQLAVPRKANLQGLVGGDLIFTLQEDWGAFKSGALIALDLDKARKQPANVETLAALIVQPGARETIDDIATTKSHVVVQLLSDVKGAIDVYAKGAGGWRAKRLALPKGSDLILRAQSNDSEDFFVSSESFLEPTALWAADAGTGKVERIAALPARFNAATHVVEQHWATSADGTKIPYFLVRPKKMKQDGTTPVAMYGYGGFQISKPPVYLPEMGKLWLEKGGAYVIANIRGGGEFGPKWHQAALRENRQRAFDDFAAVAKDLFARKITSPRHLGIYGRSNGGVLTTVSMTQHPELWNAIVVESPLVDMLRYNRLSAGASWTGEYGDPDVPGDRAFIAAYSAYQKLAPGAKYPEPYITTNTEDDRVHPGHARKFAARLSELGSPYLYYENTFGGHANDADPDLNARRWARHYVYLSQKLMD